MKHLQVKMYGGCLTSPVRGGKWSNSRPALLVSPTTALVGMMDGKIAAPTGIEVGLVVRNLSYSG
jgi:hypothetical protein